MIYLIFSTHSIYGSGVSRCDDPDDVDTMALGICGKNGQTVPQNTLDDKCVRERTARRRLSLSL